MIVAELTFGEYLPKLALERAVELGCVVRDAEELPDEGGTRVKVEIHDQEALDAVYFGREDEEFTLKRISDDGRPLASGRLKLYCGTCALPVSGSTVVAGSRTKFALALAGALLLGALLRDLLVSPARAEDDVIRRTDVTSIVRALEKQAEATRDLAREVRDAGRGCR